MKVKYAYSHKPYLQSKAFFCRISAVCLSHDNVPSIPEAQSIYDPTMFPLSDGPHHVSSYSQHKVMVSPKFPWNEKSQNPHYNIYIYPQHFPIEYISHKVMVIKLLSFPLSRYNLMYHSYFPIVVICTITMYHFYSCSLLIKLL